MPRVFVKTVFRDIRFKCQRCGTCCHHKRPPDFEALVPLERLREFWEKSNLIYQTKEDIENICRSTGRRPADFVDTLFEYDGKCVHVDDSGERIILDFPVMKSKEDTTCVFYDSDCRIYSDRPRACRLFPFRVEEEETPEGDIILNIGYNPTCPGIGKGKKINKKVLEMLVVGQFRDRSEAVAAEMQELAREGKIQSEAKVFRTFPGKRA
ncbi:Putative zinc- or iron-chelating domain protein [uncultured archaeon]|nr:Putative zinc- or iron-chelating domain protein [uncultured archaeon]